MFKTIVSVALIMALYSGAAHADSLFGGNTGSGSVVRATSPVLTTPNIGTATGSITGNAATVTTNANLTGDVTSSGNASTVVKMSSLGGNGTKPVIVNNTGVFTAPASGIMFSKAQALAVTSANSSISIPANAFIQQIIIENTTANAVTGGIKIGTTASATDVVAALTVAGNTLTPVLPTAMLKPIFSTSASQTLFIDAVVAWNSASVNVTVVYGQL